MKVSVIIPVYNAERFLEQCIKSLQAQTMAEFELICVDDGSTDNSVKIIEEFQERDWRIKLLHEENKGGGAARNLGMTEASGEYLLFLDADDYFEPDMLRAMSARMDETGSDICITKVRCWHEDLNFYTDEYAAMRDEFLPEKEIFSYQDMPGHIFNTFHNWPWNKMFRRSFVMENGLKFQEIMRTNDLYFTCTALVSAKRITTVKEVLVNYRVGASGNCQNTNTRAPLDFYEAFLKLKDYLETKGIYEEVKQSFVNHALDGCVANLLSQEGSVAQETLYHQLRGGLFQNLDIKDQPAEYYYNFNQRMYKFYQTIMEQDYVSFLRLRIQDLKEERDTCLRLNHIEKMGLIDWKDQIIREKEEWAQHCQGWAEDAERRVKEVYDSFSYKAGHAVTAPIRMGVRAARKAVKGKE